MPDEPTPAASRFATLPERIRVEDTIASVETEAAPDPTMGRDTETEFMLRNAR
ncbi:heme biosynthesis protein HemY [Cellulomonas sp. ICMP 17802]|uniref:heme biosynthesis protein HemY n=1 Tax=Cellulomonas sp. ICMP 17802 TaxID=3239199 RepID=UPI00351AFBFC